LALTPRADHGRRLTQVQRIADFASMRRLPSFCAWREFADTGRLVSYGYDLVDDFRHASACQEDPRRSENPATCRSFKIACPKAAVEQCKE
jgi:hypothetical protein